MISKLVAISQKAFTGWAALAVVLLLQISYFIRHVRDGVLYRDEANDVFTANLPWSELVRFFCSDWDPYVWIITLRLWTGIWGTSEIAARSLPAVAFCAATLIFFRIARRLFGDREEAIAATTIFGLAPPMLTNAIGYARPYALALLTTVWMLDRLMAVLERPSTTRLVFLGLSALAFGNIQPVNYGVAPAFVAWSIWASFATNRDRVERLRLGISVPAIIGVAALPSLVQSLRFGAAETGMAALSPEQFGIVYLIKILWSWTNASVPAIGVFLMYAFDDNPADWLHRVFAKELWWPALLGIVPILWGLSHWVRHICQNVPRSIVLPALLMLILPLIILSFGSLKVERLTTPLRAYSAFGPGLAILMAVLMIRLPFLLSAVSVLSIARASAALLFLWDEPIGKRSDARDAVAWISDLMESDLVLVANPALGPSFHYYSRGSFREIVLPYEGPVLFWNDLQLWKDVKSGTAAKRVEEILFRAADQNRRVWWIWGGVDLAEPPERWAPFYLPDAYQAAQRTFRERFLLKRSAAFNQTLEPFHIELYSPRPPENP